MNLPISSFSFDDSKYFLTHSETNSKPTDKSFKPYFLKSIDSIKIEYEYNSIGTFPIENNINSNYYRSKTTVNIPKDDKLFWENLIDKGISSISIPDTSNIQFAIGCVLDLYFKIYLYENQKVTVLHFPSWGISKGSGRIFENGQLYFIILTDSYKNSLKEYLDKIIDLTFPKDISSCGYEEKKVKNKNDNNKNK